VAGKGVNSSEGSEAVSPSESILEVEMTEQEMDLETTDVVETEAEVLEEETVETEPAPDLDELDEPFKTMALSMRGIAEKAREDYVKIYDKLTSIGDPDEYARSTRNASTNPEVVEKVQAAKDLEAQIAALFSEADAILQESGEWEIPSEDEQAEMRDQQKAFKSTFDDSVAYGNDHIIAGFGRLFEPLPGVRGRRKGSTQSGDSQYQMTTSLKPQIEGAKLNGAKVVNEKGKSNFTALAQALKKESGKSVPIGDLHKAWLAAAKTDNVADITDDVAFPFTVDGKQYQIVIERSA
jgi:hypothetical protein